MIIVLVVFSGVIIWYIILSLLFAIVVAQRNLMLTLLWVHIMHSMITKVQSVCERESKFHSFCPSCGIIPVLSAFVGSGNSSKPSNFSCVSMYIKKFIHLHTISDLISEPYNWYHAASGSGKTFPVSFTRKLH